MPVLQSALSVNDAAELPDVAGLARAYVEAVAVGDPHAHAKGLALADLVWSEVFSANRAGVGS